MNSYYGHVKGIRHKTLNFKPTAAQSVAINHFSFMGIIDKTVTLSIEGNKGRTLEKIVDKEGYKGIHGGKVKEKKEFKAIFITRQRRKVFKRWNKQELFNEVAEYIKHNAALLPATVFIDGERHYFKAPKVQ